MPAPARSLTARCQTELVCAVRSASFPNRRNVAVAFRAGAAAVSFAGADRGSVVEWFGKLAVLTTTAEVLAGRSLAAISREAHELF